MIVEIKNIINKVIQVFFVRLLCMKTTLKSRSNKISVHAIYGENVKIGENVIIASDVVIGDNTYVNRNTTIENCSIGKYCSISEGVRINPTEHNLNLITTHPIAGESGHYGKKMKGHL